MADDNQFSDLEPLFKDGALPAPPPEHDATSAPPSEGNPSMFHPRKSADGSVDIGEIGNTALGGLGDAYRGMKETVADALNVPGELITGKPGLFHGDDLPMNPVEFLTRGVGLGADALTPRLTKPDSEFATAGRSVIKYLTGALAGMGAMQSARSGALPIIQTLRGGFLGDFLVASKGDDNLSNLIEEVPGMQGPIFSALAASPDDTKWEARFKAATEGLVVAPLVESLVAGIKLLKGLRVARQKDAAAHLPDFDELPPPPKSPDFHESAGLESNSGYHINRRIDLPAEDFSGYKFGDKPDPHWQEALQSSLNDAADEGWRLKILDHGSHLEVVGAKWNGHEWEKGLPAPPSVERALRLTDPFTVDPGNSFKGLTESLDGMMFSAWQRRYALNNPETLFEGLPRGANDNATREYLDAHSEEIAKLNATLKGMPEQMELFPDVVRREENIRDVQVLIRGDRVVDPVTGREAQLSLSPSVKEELAAKLTSAPNDGLGMRLGTLSEEARSEVLAALRSEKMIPEGALSGPKIVRPKPYDLTDAGRARIQAIIKDVPEGYSMSEALAYGMRDAEELKGVFNVRYMADRADVHMTLDAFAQELKPMMDARRGGSYMSFEDTRGLADWLGKSPQMLMSGLANVVRHAEMMPAYLVAGKVWMQSLTTDIARISRAIDAGTATGTAEIELMRRMSVLSDLAVNLKGLQTSAARTTAVGRIRTSPDLGAAEISHLLGEMDRDNFRIIARKIAAADGDPKAIVQMITGSAFDKSLNIANEVFINGLLSSIKTHVVNLSAGITNTFMLPTYRLVGGLLTWDKASMVEGASYLRALKAQIGDAFVMSGKAFGTESSVLDTAYRQIEVERHAIKAETFNLSEGNWIGKAVEALGIAVRMPSRFLTAEDEFLKQLNYRASVTAKASRDAYEKGLRDDVMVDYFVPGAAASTKVSQVDAHIMDRMNKAFEPSLGFAMDQAALQDARRVTFTQPLKADTWITGGTTFGERIQQMAANHPLIRHFVFPFVRVPVNIMREAQELTPLAPLKAQWWSDYKAGGAQRADAVGRMAIGTSMIIGGSLAVAEGKLTGAGPSDPELKRQLVQKGWQPYSIRVGTDAETGMPRWLSFQRADPWATVLGLVADTGYVFGKVDEKTQTEFASSLTLAVANAINSRGYLKGLTDIMSALGNGYDKEGRFEQLLVQRIASYVPAYMRDAAGVVEGEPELKRVRGVLDGLMARIPGMSDQVEAQRDNFGRKRELPMGVAWQAVNPFALSTEKPSRPYQELAMWADSPLKARFPLPNFKYDGNIDLTQYRNPNTGQTAWDRWMALHDSPLIGGKSLHEALDGVIGSSAYERLKRSAPDNIYNDHPALRMLRETMDGYREVAFERMLKEDGFEPLRSAILAYRINKGVVPLNPAARRESDTLEDLLRQRR